MPGAHPHHSNTPKVTHSLHPNPGRNCSKLPESKIPEAPTQPNAPTPCNPHSCIHRLTIPCNSPSLYPKVHKPLLFPILANPHSCIHRFTPPLQIPIPAIARPCIHRFTTPCNAPSLQFPIPASTGSPQPPANFQSCIHKLTTPCNSPSLHPQVHNPL